MSFRNYTDEMLNFYRLHYNRKYRWLLIRPLRDKNNKVIGNEAVNFGNREKWYIRNYFDGYIELNNTNHYDFNWQSEQDISSLINSLADRVKLTDDNILIYKRKPVSKINKENLDTQSFGKYLLSKFESISV